MKKLTHKIGLLAILVFASLETQAVPLNYTVIDSRLIRVTTPTNQVIRTRTEWQNFYTAATSYRIPKPPVPWVDFSRVTVVVVASGTRPSSGYQTLISGVTDEPATTTVPAQINVYSMLINPGPNCFVTAALTYPVAIFTIPRTSKPFGFGITGNAYDNCQ